MTPPIRLTLALIAGTLAAFITVALIETAGHTVYPTPAGLNYQDPAALRAYVEALPLGAKLFVLAAWLAGTIDGVLVAGLINRARYGLCAAVIACIVLAATIANLWMIPHPAWLAMAGIGGIVLCAFGMSRLLPLLLNKK